MSIALDANLDLVLARGVLPGLAGCLAAPPDSIISPKGTFVGRFILFATTWNKLEILAFARPRNPARIVRRLIFVASPPTSG
jgi:hypothetical protein